MDRLEILLRSKAFWASIGTLVAAGAGYFTGELSAGAALQMLSTGLIGLFLRDALAKGEVGRGEIRSELETINQNVERTNNLIIPPRGGTS